MEVQGPHMRPARRFRGGLAASVAVALAAAMALAGCTSARGVQQSQSATAPKQDKTAKIELGDAYIYPVDVSVAALTGQRIMSSSGSEARWAYLPGDVPFNHLLDSVVRTYLKYQAETRDVTYAPEPVDPTTSMLDRGCVSGSTAKSAREILDDPNLSLTPNDQIQQTITCEPVLAAGTTFGERLRIVRGNAQSVEADYEEVLYTNTSTGEVAKGKDLFSDVGLPVLLEALYKNLKLEQPMSAGKVIPPSDETLSGLRSSFYRVGFNDRGDAIVTVDGQFTSVLAGGDPNYQPKAETLVIPAQRAVETLTPLGQAISAAKASASQWSGAEPVPFGHSYVDCDLVPCVAVTYDDGPSAESTPVVLDAYASSPYAAATFFELGQNMPGNEELMKRIVAEGNLIGSHTMDHLELTLQDDATVTADVGNAAAKITEVTGQPVYYMRPPYGAFDDRTRFLYPQPSINWSVDTNDWQHPGTEVVVQRALEGASPNGIILMHDIHPDTVAGASEIMDGLLQRGYSLVTIGQLFHNVPPPQGTTIFGVEDVVANRTPRS